MRAIAEFEEDLAVPALIEGLSGPNAKDVSVALRNRLGIGFGTDAEIWRAWWGIAKTIRSHVGSLDPRFREWRPRVCP